MKRVMFVLLLAIAVAPSAWAQSWPNEPSGATVLSDHNWNSLTGGGWVDEGGDRRIISDPTAPLSPSNVLESRRMNNATGGANEHLYFGTKDELFVGFWWKPSNPFPGWDIGSVNKFAMFRNESGGHIYMEMESNNGVRGGPYHVFLALGYCCVQNSHLGNGWGDTVGVWNLYPNRGSFNVTLGAWHRVELYFRKSSTASSRDGILRWWVNGSLIGDYTQMNYPSGFADVGLTSIWDAPHDLGTTAEYHWYDHVRVSVPSGAGGTPKGDTLPPVAPTGLRAN